MRGSGVASTLPWTHRCKSYTWWSAGQGSIWGLWTPEERRHHNPAALSGGEKNNKDEIWRSFLHTQVKWGLFVSITTTHGYRKCVRFFDLPPLRTCPRWRWSSSWCSHWLPWIWLPAIHLALTQSWGQRKSVTTRPRCAHRPTRCYDKHRGTCEIAKQWNSTFYKLARDVVYARSFYLADRVKERSTLSMFSSFW